MSRKLKKFCLLLLAAVLLVGVSFVQKSLNVDRDKLGLTRVPPLENAPPILAFTTVALGGFRGLISNALWMRATDLQDEDKFFEMAQLADWITKLEPHFVQVWLVQAWNMAYNISVKFKETAPGEYPDRWRWVKRGIELLRDDGLRFNPNETLIYRELAWFFQHKMGENLDDANMYYKEQWADKEMVKVFGKSKPNLDELINPKTPDQIARAAILTNEFKMDAKFMKKVDERYGPLEWRLPEAHAIYWAAVGLEKAKENPDKISEDDLITLRRIIYQSMQLSFHRGRLVANPFVQAFEFGPNLDIVQHVSDAYEQAAREDVKNADHIEKAHRNFLRTAVYFLYEYDRVAEAAKWFKYLCQKYPNKPLVDGDQKSLPGTLTLDQYAVAQIAGEINDTSHDKVTAIVEGALRNAYDNLVLGEEDHFGGYKLMARKVWDTYMSKIPKERISAIGLTPFEDIDKDVVNRFLDPKGGVPFEARAILRSRLGMPAETAPPPAGTNAPPENAIAPPANVPAR